MGDFPKADTYPAIWDPWSSLDVLSSENESTLSERTWEIWQE